MESGQNEGGEAAAVFAVAFDATASLRSYLSTHHLYAARYLAQDANERERALASRAPLFDARHRGLVLASVTESVAFVEAAINEVYVDATEERGSYFGQLSADCRSHMATLWEATGDRLQALDKYNLALSFANRPKLEKGENPYQDAKRLIELRNYVVHYKPHERTTDDPHRHEGALKGKFPENALMSGSGNPWFPDHAFGAGCAEWAWRSARSLAAEFSKRMGLRLNYEIADFEDPLPR
ncbi:hypothetical protein ACQEWB_33440 [Streptomyces sp. CA-249302]|uniref:hypothetical protein n=1 Tax=Streptomyces sp. CA-249302 TaxID=3240058 RepID=UPI003D944745